MKSKAAILSDFGSHLEFLSNSTFKTKKTASRTLQISGNLSDKQTPDISASNEPRSANNTQKKPIKINENKNLPQLRHY